MANRHLARGTVLQTLYEWDFGGKKSDIQEIFERNVSEFITGTDPSAQKRPFAQIGLPARAGDRRFMENLLSGVSGKHKDLDSIIEKAAPDWPIDKISIMDRNILRIGLYELLFSDRQEVPPKVAINEAIELGKTYGSESSSKFINGVLGAVYREMGEPGKDDEMKAKKPIPTETLAGAVVYAKKENDIYLCLVHDVFGYWTLSKGHIDPEKIIEEELKRAVNEELGMDVKVKDNLGHTEYGTFDPEKGKIKKKVEYYLAESKYVDVKLKESGGLDDAQWFRLADILDLNFYDDILPIVTKAIDILVSK